MRQYSVRRAADVTRDLDRIEDHLVRIYLDFGEDVEAAVERAASRIDDALIYMRTFVAHPHRGTEQAIIRTGIRSVTHKNFIFYFEVDDPSLEVRILAIFFGGVDHRQQILDRLQN